MTSRWGLVLLGLLSVVGLSISLWLADLLGISKAYINGFFLVLSIIGYALIGMFCRTTRPDEYFVAGRRISAPFNGMATAADWMSAASFIGLTGLLVGLLAGPLAPIEVAAQSPPYDVFPEAAPPYYRVRYEASTKTGELPYAVNYTIWIPPQVTTLRGVVVHQHG